MAKFKELLKEAVGGVVSTPAINAGHGVAGGRNQQMSGDSRVDTGGQFTFRADELPDNDFNDRSNPKTAFADTENQGPDSVVLHEDEGGSVTLRDHGNNFDVVIRAGSQEKVFELDEEDIGAVREFFA